MKTENVPLRGCDVLPPMQSVTTKVPRPSVNSEDRKATNRFQVLNTFLDVTIKDLDRSTAFVWMLLYRDTKPDGYARASYGDLARRAGINQRTAGRAIMKLKKLGLITVVHKGGKFSGPSMYKVIPKLSH